MRAYLKVTAGPDLGKEFVLAEGLTLRIGRGPMSDTFLTDTSVSRQHCTLRWAENRFLLTDLDSVAGIRVDGKKVRECALKPDQEFRIGGTTLRLHATAVVDVFERKPAHASTPARKLERNSIDFAGKPLSHYQLGEMVAHGRTGVIYKARDTRDNREVAVKVLHSEFTKEAADVKRFIRAMNTAIELKHPNLIALHAAGKSSGLCWLAMEFVDGDPLTRLIEQFGTLKMLDWRFALTVGVQVAQALDVAHEKNIIHRNVSPGSIMIRKTDHAAKLGDMMFAKALDGIKAKQITTPGELVGDVAFMSPERTHSHARVDTRSDIYALGATLYALLTGKPPFCGKSPIETVALIRQSDPVPPKKFQLSIPDKFQDAVMMMLAKAPEDRYQTPARVARSLEQVAKYQGIPF